MKRKCRAKKHEKTHLDSTFTGLAWKIPVISSSGVIPIRTSWRDSGRGLNWWLLTYPDECCRNRTKDHISNYTVAILTSLSSLAECEMRPLPEISKTNNQNIRKCHPLHVVHRTLNHRTNEHSSGLNIPSLWIPTSFPNLTSLWLSRKGIGKRMHGNQRTKRTQTLNTHETK